MRYSPPNTIFLIALLALSTGATAQKIYKCGNTYSQQTCPDGIVIPTAATPEAAQKNATDQATRRDALTADRMEKSRLQQEKENLAANTPKLKREPRPPEAETVTAVSPSFKKRKVKRHVKESRTVVPGKATAQKTLRRQIAGAPTGLNQRQPR